MGDAMAYLKEPDRQPFLRIPAATTGLLVVLVIAHIARVLAPAQRAEAIIYNYAFYPARYSHAFLVAQGNQSQSLWGRVVPFVSYIFLHGSFTHLAINCALLLAFGSVVARRFGALLFFAFFILCGVAGAFAYLFSNWGSMNWMWGASGAISGLIAAAFRIVVPIEARDVQSFSLAVSGNPGTRQSLAPLISPRLWLWSALFVIVNVVLGRQFGVGPGAQLVAWQAHLGGYFAGLLLASPADYLARRSRS